MLAFLHKETRFSVTSSYFIFEKLAPQFSTTKAENHREESVCGKNTGFKQCVELRQNSTRKLIKYVLRISKQKTEEPQIETEEISNHTRSFWTDFTEVALTEVFWQFRTCFVFAEMVWRERGSRKRVTNLALSIASLANRKRTLNAIVFRERLD